MKKYLLCCLTSFLLITTSLHGQESTSKITNKLRVKAVTGNYSSSINDGYIELNVLEGTPPYTFKWSNRETALASNKASGLVEGIQYKVIITDAENQLISKSYTIEAKSITEKFNGNFTP